MTDAATASSVRSGDCVTVIVYDERKKLQVRQSKGVCKVEKVLQRVTACQRTTTCLAMERVVVADKGLSCRGLDDQNNPAVESPQGIV